MDDQGEMGSVTDVLPGMDYGVPDVSDYAQDDFKENLQTRIRALVADARDYNDTVLAPAREKADLYFNGQFPALEEEGRSTIVATEVKDVIMAVMPSLMRIFTSSEPVCSFLATNEKQVPLARQATDYINYKLMQHWDGYLLLSSAIMDALRKGGGVVQWYTDPAFVTVSLRDYQGLSEMQVRAFLDQVPNAELIDAQPSQSQPGTYDIRVRVSISAPRTRAEAVPPEEFRIGRDVKSVSTAQIVGRERMMRAAELVAMGYHEDDLRQFAGSGHSFTWSLEAQFRNPGALSSSDNADPDADMIVHGEYYILIDSDGDGVEELNFVRTLGDNDTVMSIEPVDRRNLAVFLPDLEPHTVIAHSLAEYCYDLQRIKTNLFRNTLDSLAQTIYPRQVVNENVVNIDDVLNTELGAPIRTRGDPATSVVQLQTRFDGEQVMPVFAYLDQIRQLRTGVSEASKGVDPRALQSTTVKGVDMLISGAQERIELIARNLAHTGLRDLFAGLLAEVCEHPYVEEIMFVRGSYIPVDPSKFSPGIPVQVNPNIGKGTDADRMLMLTQVKATQEMILDKFGPQNPLVSPVEYRATLEDLLSIANIKDVGRYFKPVTQADIDNAMAQADAKAKSQPNPQLILANAELEKVRSSTAKAVADDNFRHLKLETDNEYRHMQLQMQGENMLITALGQYGIKLDHDMASHVISTMKDLHIAESGSDQGEGASGEDAS